MANPHPEPHPENLRPCRKGDPANKVKGRNGGRASQAKQAQKRTMREWAEIYGQLPMKKGTVKTPKSAEDIKTANPTMDGAIIAAMYSKAIKGDTKAAEFLAKLKGMTGEDVTVHIDTMAQMDTADLLKLYNRTKGDE